jgi:hypothetical protein
MKKEQLALIGEAVVAASGQGQAHNCQHGHGVCAGIVVVELDERAEPGSIELRPFCPKCHPQHADEHGHPVYVRIVSG